MRVKEYEGNRPFPLGVDDGLKTGEPESHSRFAFARKQG